MTPREPLGFVELVVGSEMAATDVHQQKVEENKREEYRHELRSRVWIRKRKHEQQNEDLEEEERESEGRKAITNQKKVKNNCERKKSKEAYLLKILGAKRTPP